MAWETRLGPLLAAMRQGTAVEGSAVGEALKAVTASPAQQAAGGTGEDAAQGAAGDATPASQPQSGAHAAAWAGACSAVAASAAQSKHSSAEALSFATLEQPRTPCPDAAS